MRIATEGTSTSETGGTLRLAGSRIHMVGIGGCGMMGAASILLRLGAKVSGSDLVMAEGIGALVREGARIGIGHRAELVPPDVDLLVRSSAVPLDNPEVEAAIRRCVPLLTYAELVGALMDHYQGVAIAGTHGKTTTTAMCAFVLRFAGLAPSFLIGGRCDQLGGHSGVDSGDHLVVESCEYGRSFLKLHPRFGAILNVEPDHLDCYADLADIAGAFAAFAGRVARSGLLVCHADDRLAREACRNASCRVETFGASPGSDWCVISLGATDGLYAFEVRYQDRSVLKTRLSIPGWHNVLNAAAAVALAVHAGARAKDVSAALPLFEGVQRRLTLRGLGRGVTVVDDYAHHPTELRVTIEAARQRYQAARVWVVFQPHQRSRTRYLMNDFAGAFHGADRVIVMDVYSVRDGDCGSAEEVSAGAGDSAPATGSRELASRIRRCGGRAEYVSSLEDAVRLVLSGVGEGDLVLTMGAGDVWKVADELVERLCGSDPTRCASGAPDLVSTGRTGEVHAASA